MDEPVFSHFIARIPLLMATGVVFGCCAGSASWHTAGCILVGYLVFVLLTHRLHNKAAQWIDDNTDFYGPA